MLILLWPKIVKQTCPTSISFLPTHWALREIVNKAWTLNRHISRPQTEFEGKVARIARIFIESANHKVKESSNERKTDLHLTFSQRAGISCRLIAGHALFTKSSNWKNSVKTFYFEIYLHRKKSNQSQHPVSILFWRTANGGRDE